MKDKSWESAFDELCNQHGGYLEVEGQLSCKEIFKQGYIAALKSVRQPVIQLPEKCIVVENDPPHWINAKRGFDVCLDEVKKSIIAAGYKFTTGEQISEK